PERRQISDSSKSHQRKQGDQQRLRMRKCKQRDQCDRRGQLWSGKMPAAFPRAIRTPANRQHSNKPSDKWDRADPSDLLEVRPSRETLQHRRHPKPKRIAACIGKKQSSCQDQHRRMSKRLPDGHLFDICFRAPFFFQLGNEPIPFVRGKPPHFVGPIRKNEERRNAQNDRRNSFQQKKPTPTRKIQPVDAQNFSSNRSANDKTDRNRCHETGDGFGPVCINEPMGEINDDAGKKPRLGRAKQETRAVELMRSVDKAGQRRQRSPCDQGYRQQKSRAPAFDQQRSRNLQRKITNEKDSACGAEDGIGEAQIAFHSKRCVSDVGSVQVVGEVEKKKKRQETPRNSTARTFSGF